MAFKPAIEERKVENEDMEGSINWLVKWWNRKPQEEPRELIKEDEAQSWFTRVTNWLKGKWYGEEVEEAPIVKEEAK